MLEADHRIAKSLGLDIDQAAVIMARLWGRTFTAERDSREPGANPQKRGRISRELKADIQEDIGRGDSDLDAVAASVSKMWARAANS